MKRIAIITGASSGLGAAFALQYAQHYAARQNCDELWLIARRKEKLQHVKEQITSDCKQPLTVRIFPFDIAGHEGFLYFEQLLKTEKQQAPFTIILLINNAGFGVYGAFQHNDVHKQLSMIDVNVYALTAFCSAALPFMQKNACIINTASMAAFLPVGNFCVYAATKAYVLSFSLALRAELKKTGITVLALCPGQVDTEFAIHAVNNEKATMKHAQSAEKVAVHCLACAEKNHSIIIQRISWKLQAFFSRFIGKKFFAWFTFNYVKRIQ